MQFLISFYNIAVSLQLAAVTWKGLSAPRLGKSPCNTDTENTIYVGMIS
jgi:hypothetical protein